MADRSSEGVYCIGILAVEATMLHDGHSVRAGAEAHHKHRVTMFVVAPRPRGRDEERRRVRLTALALSHTARMQA